MVDQIPQAINNAGLAGGFESFRLKRARAPFLWQNGQTHTLTICQIPASVTSDRINNLGQAVGFSGPTMETSALQNSYAALWQNGQVTNPDNSGNFSRA